MESDENISNQPQLSVRWRKWPATVVRRLDAYLRGYDVFVSYTWSDGRQYAQNLVSALEREGYRCFLDSDEYMAGSDLTRDAKIAVKNSSAAAVVVTPEALKSHHVRKEVRLFDEAKKPLVPIDIDGTMYKLVQTGEEMTRWEQSPRVQSLLGSVSDDERIAIEKTLKRISRDQKIQISEERTTEPSAETLEKLSARFSFSRNLTRRLRVFGLIAGLLLSLLILTLWLQSVTVRQRNAAIVEAEVNRLVALSLKIEKYDATKAAATIDNAVRLSESSKSVLATRNQILSNNNLYSRSFSEHNSTVSDVDISPDGTRFLSASHDGTVKVWDKHSTVKLILKDPGQGEFEAAAFSHDGNLIVTGDKKGWITIWNSRGKRLSSFRAHLQQVSSLEFSPDGKTILSSGLDVEAYLWTSNGDDWTSLKKEPLSGHNLTVADATYSSDGKLILTGGFDGTAILRDGDGDPKITLRDHRSQVTCVALSPNNTYLATGGADNEVIIYDMRGKRTATLRGHSSEITDVSFSQDSNSVLTSSADNTVRHWDINGIEKAVFRGHDSRITSICFTPDGRSFLTGSRDETAKFWSVSGSQIATSAERAWVGRFARDSRNVVLGTDGNVVIWNFKTGESKSFPAHDGPVTCLALSRNDDLILTGGRDGKIKLWGPGGNLLCEGDKKHSDSVNAIDFLEQKQALISAGEDGTVRLWSYSGEELKLIRIPGSKIYSLSVTPDGTRFATGGTDRITRLWDFDGNFIEDFSEPNESSRIINAIKISPDGKTLATGGLSGSCNIFDFDEKSTVAAEGHLRPINALDFSDDGQHIVTGSGDGTARVWDLRGNEILSYYGEENSVLDVDFSLDGNHILVVGQEAVTVWKSLATITEEVRRIEPYRTVAPIGENSNN